MNNEPGSFYAWTVWNNHEEHSMVLPDDIRQCLVDTDSIRSCSTVLPGQHSLFLYGTLAAIRECISKLSDIHPPVHIHGRSTPYLVLGPCSINDHPQDLFQMGILHDGCAWRTDLLNVAVRPYVEVPLFGRWTYPLGVTLYGLLSAGRFLGEESYVNYVMNHMQQVTQIQEYAAWDTEKWGFAGVNQQLCWLDALDDCGSFASLTLECDRNGTDPHVRKIADHIEHYMLNEQLRLDDGTFCRRDQTIWIDDMYMSIPFLCRYSAMTGKNEPVEECIKQMFHYRNLFFMPEKKILGHMMCLIHMKNNQIPWSRGNGWVIFSLSELLMHLDPSHPQWNELLQYFITLTEGYLRLQDENGLWHQILDEPGTYPESSSTAMFICAFCRGLRFRWYPKEMLKQIEQAAMKAWKGLTRYTIDRHGNLYGVCQGSGCSFSRAYYRSLMWNFNDTHGIGIVILAGVEILKLQEEAESEPDMLPTAYFLSTD